MSAKHGPPKRLDERYETPAWCVEALLRAWRPQYSERVLDPCVGNGAIPHAYEAVDPHPKRVWTLVDIAPETSKICDLPDVVCGRVSIFSGDFFSIVKTRPRVYFDLCIMNPPYSLAEEFIRKARECSREVAALLRLGFLAGQKRNSWLRSDPPNVYVLSRRPSFTGRGTDATDYAWFVWDGSPYRDRGGGDRYGMLRILDIEGGGKR